MSGIHVMHFTSKYFRFYCNSNKLGTPRFQSLKSMEFQKNCSLSNLVSSLKLKKKSVLYLFCLGHEMKLEGHHHPVTMKVKLQTLRVKVLEDEQ